MEPVMAKKKVGVGRGGYTARVTRKEKRYSDFMGAKILN